VDIEAENSENQKNVDFGSDWSSLVEYDRKFLNKTEHSVSGAVSNFFEENFPSENSSSNSDSEWASPEAVELRKSLKRVVFGSSLSKIIRQKAGPFSPFKKPVKLKCLVRVCVAVWELFGEDD
jgi:hypothetical protein